MLFADLPRDGGRNDTATSHVLSMNRDLKFYRAVHRSILKWGFPKMGIPKTMGFNTQDALYVLDR